MNDLWLLVLGMGIVTYLPRMVPMVLLQNVTLHPFVNRFLKFIPFAALGALIFPGILESTGSISSALAGMVISIALALLRMNIMLVVAGGIAGVFVWELFT